MSDQKSIKILRNLKHFLKSTFLFGKDQQKILLFFVDFHPFAELLFWQKCYIIDTLCFENLHCVSMPQRGRSLIPFFEKSKIRKEKIKLLKGFSLLRKAFFI